MCFFIAHDSGLTKTFDFNPGQIVPRSGSFKQYFGRTRPFGYNHLKTAILGLTSLCDQDFNDETFGWYLVSIIINLHPCVGLKETEIGGFVLKAEEPIVMGQRRELDHLF
jgi:hypothetical protein